MVTDSEGEGTSPAGRETSCERARDEGRDRAIPGLQEKETWAPSFCEMEQKNLEGVADGVVEGGADFLDLLGLAVGPGAVGEQDDGDAFVEVDP